MPRPPRIPLPTDWPDHVKSIIVHVISLAQMVLTAARSRATTSRTAHRRLRAEIEDARREVSQLKEELRIKDLRLARVKPRRRPHYRPIERLAILELRAARGWSVSQTARRFLLRPTTISSWMRRLDEGGGSALLETDAPVNRLPDFVRYIVRRLKVLCPIMGKKRIAQVLARAGIVVGVSTVKRILSERDDRIPEEAKAAGRRPRRTSASPVQAPQPNHTWQVDLTLVPTAAGFWTAWIPFSLLQVWPFCWWVAIVADHYSRRVMGFAIFGKEPKSVDMQSFLGRVIRRAQAKPKYIVSDNMPTPGLCRLPLATPVLERP